MEITKEIKATVFSPYIGQYIEVCEGNYRAFLLHPSDITDIYIGQDKFNIKLALIPLLKITDEDAIEVAQIAKPNTPTYWNHQNGKSLLFENWKRDEADKYVLLEIFQFLQSKGYDLPNYLLGGKTLIESGLAIDKTTINL